MTTKPEHIDLETRGDDQNRTRDIGRVREQIDAAKKYGATPDSQRYAFDADRIIHHAEETGKRLRADDVPEHARRKVAKEVSDIIHERLVGGES